MDWRLDDDARSGHADLTLVDEKSKACGVYGVVHIGIPQHDEGTLPAHFQRDLLGMRRALDRQLATYGRRTGKRNQPNPGIRNEGLPQRRTISGNYVQYTRRESGILEDLCNLEPEQRGFL